ncbi:MAG: hypothetical protein JXB23_17065, partial [Candidatus Aminicenantes bacterium]|nr:hypothetical protein [Candidatus Aminicenantes bacterium]
GIFSSWVLRTLEEKRRIYTFHACALAKGDELLLILGGAGAGKTVFILAGLEMGWRIFSTEFVHFRLNGGIEFLKGPVKDPVRLETLEYYFPWIVESLGVNLKKTVGGKALVDLSRYQTEARSIKNPLITLVIPHVEEKREMLTKLVVEEEEFLLRKLFHNASDKIGTSTLLYGRLAVTGLDSSCLARMRKENIQNLLRCEFINKAVVWISGIKDVADFFRQMESSRTKELNE